jgi:hypothetical protein
VSQLNFGHPIAKWVRISSAFTLETKIEQTKGASNRVITAANCLKDLAETMEKAFPATSAWTCTMPLICNGLGYAVGRTAAP